MNDSSSARPRSRVLRVFAFTWSALLLLQRIVLQLFFFLLLIGVVMLGVSAWRSDRPEALKDKTLLQLEFKGALREQPSGSSRDSLMPVLGGGKQDEVLLRDVLRAIDLASRDPHIAALRLKLDDFGGAGLSSLREVAAALERFKATGKPIIVWGRNWDQRDYFIAAHATQVWLHPMGTVMLEGLGRQRNYYKEALDKLGVQANVLRVGKFKNAGEPYFASGPSKETLESEAYVYDELWALYTRSVEKARGLPDGAIRQAIDSLPASLEAAGGDSAKWALQQKWVDALKTEDEVERALKEQFGVKGEGKAGSKGEGKTENKAENKAESKAESKDSKTEAVKAVASAGPESKRVNVVGLQAYLRLAPPAVEGPAVAVVVAEGEIGDGEAPSGRIGGDSTSKLIRQVRENDQYKALVLRVNSPGGSAFASEQIRHELELVRKQGKPVVISMGDVAASGGYWIAMAADEVIADEATITGSIGVFGMLPTAQALLDKVGVRTGGYRTTWLAGAYDIRRDLDPRYARLVQAGIGRIYTDFTTKAAVARGTTPEAIDAVAQGRIWTGAQARGHGLIDRTGRLEDALQAARERAKLEESAPVRYVEKGVKPVVRLLRQLGLDAAMGEVLVALGWPSAEAAWGLDPGLRVGWQALGGGARELSWLGQVMEQREPFAAVVHCLCEPGL